MYSEGVGVRKMQRFKYSLAGRNRADWQRRRGRKNRTERGREEKRGEKWKRKRERKRERKVRSNNVRAKASTAFPCEGADRKGWATPCRRLAHRRRCNARARLWPGQRNPTRENKLFPHLSIPAPARCAPEIPRSLEFQRNPPTTPIYTYFYIFTDSRTFKSKTCSISLETPAIIMHFPFEKSIRHNFIREEMQDASRPLERKEGETQRQCNQNTTPPTSSQ